MTVVPTRRAISPPQRALPPGDPAQRGAVLQREVEALRPGPVEWARRLWSERGARRVQAAGARALTRLDRLGPAWHIADLPRTEVVRDPRTGAEIIDGRASFLAIGPAGIYAVTVVDHGRARVLLAGDVVQINGRRPPYVTDARRDAKRAGRNLSAAVGLAVPVTPVLAFVGSGAISAHGLPRNCLVTTHRELDQVLVAGGARISATTAAKVAAVARHASTWTNSPYRPASGYRWYPGAQTATDKRPSPR